VQTQAWAAERAELQAQLQAVQEAGRDAGSAERARAAAMSELRAREAEKAELQDRLLAAEADVAERAAAAAQAQAWAAERAEMQAQLGQLRAAAQPATPFAHRNSAGAAVRGPPWHACRAGIVFSRHTSGLCCYCGVPGDTTGIRAPLACRPHMLSCERRLPCRHWYHSGSLTVQLPHGRRRLRGDRARERRACRGRAGRAGGRGRGAAGRAARERPQARQLAAAGRRGAPRTRDGRRLRQARGRRRPRRQPGAAGDAAGVRARRGPCIFGGVGGACPLAPCMLHGQVRVRRHSSCR